VKKMAGVNAEKERKTKALEYLSDLLLFAALGVIVSIVDKPMWSGGIPGWCDNYAHAQKIWFTSNYLRQYWRIPAWDPNGGCGYPIYQFYPPFSYLIASFLAILHIHICTPNC